MSEAAEVPLRIAPRRRLIEDWALVLVAEGLAPSVHETREGFVLSVAFEEAEQARAALDAYERENPAPPDAAREPAGSSHLRITFAVSGALVAFFLVTGPRDPRVTWFARGSADAEQILLGELWRVVTSLTLHADLMHVIANAIVGALFLSPVCRALGPGLGCLLVLVAGAGGNLANAWLHATQHVAVGASTAVFGAVGLLGGLGVVRRRRSGARGRSAWVPIAAGLALLAMLGTSGERVDLWAHLLGFGVGAALGIPTGVLLPHPPGQSAQRGFGIAALVLLLYAWQLALG